MLSFSALSSPAIVLTGAFTLPATVQTILTNITTTAWYILATAAIVCFVYAGILFLSAQGDPGKLETAKKAVIFGVVGVVVGILAYSIVPILKAILVP